MPRVSVIYRFYFLWFEPLAAFLGGLAGMVDPHTIINGITPLNMAVEAAAPVTALSRLLVAQLCSSYLLFAWNQAVILRFVDDLAVWRLLIVGMILSDGGHLYGLYSAGSEAFCDVAAWRNTDWINEGTLLLGLLLRIGFLLGLGVSKKR